MSLARNTLFLTGSMVVQKIVSLGYFAMLARYLGASAMGSYAFALSLTTLCAIISDFGLTPAITRVIAGGGEERARMVSAGLLIKGICMVLAVGAVWAIAIGRGYDASILALLPYATLVMVFDAVHTLWYGMLRGLRLLKYEALGMVCGQILVVIVGGIGIALKLHTTAFLWALLAGSALNVMLGGFIVYRKGLLSELIRPTGKAVRTLLKLSLLFGLAGLFARGYSQFDVVLIQEQLGSAAVGIYAVAAKVVFALQFIPIALSASLFPAIASVSHDTKAMRDLVVRSLRYLSTIAIPLSVLLWGFSGAIVHTVFGTAYDAAALPLSIVAVSIIFGFLDYPLGAYLNGSGKTAIQTTALGITLAVNVLANLILLPRLGVVGSAYAALIGQSTLFLVGFFATRSLLAPTYRLLSLYMAKIMGISLVALMIARYSAEFTQGILSLCTGFLVYGILVGIGLLVFRLVRISELKQLTV